MNVPRAHGARVAIVTGAAGGQGAEHARRLAADGFQVVATDLLDAPPNSPGGGFCHLDVTSEKQWSDVGVSRRCGLRPTYRPSPGWAANAVIPADQLVADIPLGRLGVPADISALVSFLASEASSYITGADIVIDGGIRARI